MDRGALARMAGRLAALSGWRADVAGIVAGLLSSLALPPLYLVPVLLLTIPALLCQIGTATGPRQAARRGWWFGFGLHMAGLYWITEAILIEADRFWWVVPFAVPALALFGAIFVAATAAVTRLAPPGWRRVVVLAGAWTLADLARQFALSGFPWNPLGSVWEWPGWPGDVMIQAASLVGVHGLTFATVLLAGLPMLDRRWWIGGAIGMALWVGFGVVRLQQPLPPGPDLTVLLVQGNVAQGEKWDRAVMVSIFRHYLELTRQAVAGVQGPAVVIWPETASPALLETDSQARVLIAEAAGGHPTLIGGVRFDPRGRPMNSLFALGSAGEIQAIYDKWHLVPFGEYQPDWWPESVELFPGGGFKAGPGPRTLTVPGLPPFGPLICYEAIFSAQGVDSAHRPDWLVNVTNDAWFGNTSGPRQHLAAARLRAVEEGLPLVRAANTGISAGFDARGHEVARLGLNQTGVVSFRLPAMVVIPLYAKIGLYIPFLLGVIALLSGFVWPAAVCNLVKTSKT